MPARFCPSRVIALSLGAFISTSFGAAPLQTDIDVKWTSKNLEARKAEQVQAAKQFKAFHGFSFKDEVDRSQINFHPNIVDDCTRFQKATIYDHGTGLAAGDVDNDGKIDIYFVNQMGGCELWRNLGDARFENITQKAGVGLKDKVCVSASFADVDNDGDPDLFVTTVRMGNVLFENLGNGKFRDVSKESGLDYVGHSSAAIFFDFDKDGLLDLFVSNVGVYTTDEIGRGGYYSAVKDIGMSFTMPERNQPSFLYRNLGGLKFKEVSREMGIEHFNWSPDATICDLNEDGFPDLYVLNMAGANTYYENVGGKSFTNKSSAFFPRSSNGSMGIKYFDFNQDGKLDLYVTDMHSDMSPAQVKLSNRNLRLDFEKAKSEGWCGIDWTPEVFRESTNRLIYGNALYLNTGQKSFNEISDQANAETFWPWGPSVGDLNADGYDDAFITAGMGFPLRYSINSVLLNDGGKKFMDAEFLLDLEPRKQLDHDYFTLDCSGDDKNNLLCYHKSGTLMVRGAHSSRSSFIADLDGDGDLDIVAAEFNDRPQIFISDLTKKRKIHYVQIKLVGTTSNRDALGATVRVKAGGKTLTQYNDGKSGYLSQSSLPLYFGLGEATKVDAIEVAWPSGKMQTVSANLGINQQIRITEPAQ